MLTFCEDCVNGTLMPREMMPKKVNYTKLLGKPKASLFFFGNLFKQTVSQDVWIELNRMFHVYAPLYMYVLM